MNLVLREEIVKHIFANLAIIPSNFINLNKTKTIKTKEFLTEEKIPFVGDNGSIIKNNIWACQSTVDGKEFKMLLGDCSADTTEYALLITMKDNPSYGIYYVPEYHEALIAVSLDGKEWLECQTYLQATFLAGMEQTKEIGLVWNKSIVNKDNLSALLNFIKFYNRTYESNNV